jgi:sulfoxide reductase heme-binding subunit YedZ
MDIKARIALILSGAAAFFMFALFSYWIRDSRIILLETRALGLIAYFFLFLSIILGEMRMLSKGKMEFLFFRYHKPVAAVAILLSVTHFIPAVLDNYQGGRGIPFTQYLGFSFSDQWLAYLSMGSLAFYLMITIAFTSSIKVMRSLGQRWWRPVHYLSYAAFVLAFTHAVNLGTDIRTSALHTILYPLTVLSFITVIGLLLTRIVNSLDIFTDMTEVGLAAAFFTLLMAFSALLLSDLTHLEERMSVLQEQLEASAGVASQTTGVVIANTSPVAQAATENKGGDGDGSDT